MDRPERDSHQVSRRKAARRPSSVRATPPLYPMLSEEGSQIRGSEEIMLEYHQFHEWARRPSPIITPAMDTQEPM